MVSELEGLSGRSMRHGSQEIQVEGFGLLSVRHLDPDKSYRGCLYGLAPETLKSIADSSGFSARFDLPGIKIACLDIHGGEGEVVLEIARNTKPADICVRYARDRWSMHEVYSKVADSPRPWIKSQYRAKALGEQILANLAELLALKADEISHYYIRINFKEKTFALLSEERYAGQFPGGELSHFHLPQSDIASALATADRQMGASADRQMGASADRQTDATADRQTEATQDRQPQATGTEYGASGEPALADSQEVKPRLQDSTIAGTHPDFQSPARQPAKGAGNEPLTAARDERPPGETQEPGAPATAGPPETSPQTTAGPPETSPQAAAELPEAVTVSAPDTPGTPSPQATEPLPPVRAASHSQPESGQAKTEPIIARQKANDRITTTQSSQPRPFTPDKSSRQETMDTQVKYAVYSKSEIDNLLKQQVESITASLSSKISHSQKSLQEALESQNKTFTRLTDNFTGRLESAATKLESTARSSEQTTAAELDLFKKQLTRELETHRSQINKTLLPAGKALPEKAPRQQKEKQTSQPVILAGPSRDPLVLFLLAAILVASLANTFLLVASLSGLSTLTQTLKQLEEISKDMKKLVNSGMHE